MYTDGRPVTNELVWAEHVPEDEHVYACKTSPFNEYPINNAYAVTDTNGEFSIAFSTNVNQFIVKTAPENYLAAAEGPWSADHPPIDRVILTVSSEGGRLTGMFADKYLKPVTNVIIGYFISEWQEKQGGSYYTRLPYTIDKAGMYVSKMIPSGWYNFEFQAEGHPKIKNEVAIKKSVNTVLDVYFPILPLVTYTGFVYDVSTSNPVVNAVIQRVNNDKTVTDIITTDVEGRFQVSARDATTFRITHPDYITGQVTCGPRSGWGTVKNVYLELPVNVIVYTFDYDGAPATNCEVELKEVSSMRTIECPRQREENITEFSRVPAGTKEIFAIVKRKGERLSGISGQWRLLPHETKEINLTLLPPSQVFLNLSLPVKQSKFEATIAGRGKPYGVWDMFKAYNDNRWYVHVPTGSYTVILDAQDSTVRFGPSSSKTYTTNIVTTTRETVEIDIEVHTNECKRGIIEGEIINENGMPNRCTVYAMISGTNSMPKRIYSEIADLNIFRITDLNPNEVYDVYVNIMFLSNVIIRGVKPDGPPIKITGLELYRVTGSVVDEKGLPLEITTWIWNQARISLGEIMVRPLPAGTYDLEISVNCYAGIAKQITIKDRDIDLGVMIAKKGITISGRVVDAEGAFPKECYRIEVSCSRYAIGATPVYTRPDGTFTVQGVMPGERQNINWRKGYERSRRKVIGPFDEDTDIGDIVVE